MVFALDFLHDDLGGQHPIALLIEIQGDIEVGEVVLLEGVFADPQVEGAAITLVTLQQGFTQSRFHHRRGQLFLFADVLDQVGETGEQDQCHGRWLGAGWRGGKGLSPLWE